MKRLLILLVLLFVGCGTPVRECLKAHNEYHWNVEYRTWFGFTYMDYEIRWVCDEWKAR